MTATAVLDDVTTAGGLPSAALAAPVSGLEGVDPEALRQFGTYALTRLLVTLARAMAREGGPEDGGDQ